MSEDLKRTTNTRDTIYTHFWGITDNIYGFGRPFFGPSFFYTSTHISTRPQRFYLSKWRVDVSLHKAMHVSLCYERKLSWGCPARWCRVKLDEYKNGTIWQTRVQARFGNSMLRPLHDYRTVHQHNGDDDVQRFSILSGPSFMERT